jgi:glycosyltransferase involved in cell wall biosynthesis
MAGDVKCKRMKGIGLCMIVKNEARLILRCLESVQPLVDYFLVEDTGSTDGTQDIIRRWLEQENLPGEVFEEPWRDFAHNRSVAVARLREKADIDYALTIDADDILVCEPGFDPEAFKSGLDADLYHIEIRLGSIRHHRPQLFSNRLQVRYRGVLHEFIEAPAGISSGTLTGLHIHAGVEGARSEDPDKYRKDAVVLEEALQTEQEPFLRTRYTFYLAQSWKDCGEAEKALTGYLDRAGLGFWDEEVFISLYCAAQLKAGLGHPDYEIIGMFLRAYEACPRRAEALHGAARYCRATGKFRQGYMLAKQGLEIAQPGTGLFVEPWIYEYGLLDELAVNAYWVERYEECLKACERLLSDGTIPEEMRERVEMNARFSREKLALQQSSVPSKALTFNICLVTFNEHRVFDNTIRALHDALIDLGHSCSISEDEVEPGAINIVIGAVVWRAKHNSLSFLRSAPYVLYQFEQLFEDKGITKDVPEYTEFVNLANHIIEYSPSNIDYLAKHGLSDKTIYLPPSFHRSLEMFHPSPSPSIDVLLVGSHSDRRSRIMDELQMRGAAVAHVFNVYGDDLIGYMKSAKIILNVHWGYGINALETLRISYALANRCFVISEIGDHNPYGEGVVYADYDALVATCVEYLGPSADKRATIATDGYLEYRRSDLVADLRDAIQRMHVDALRLSQRRADLG